MKAFISYSVNDNDQYMISLLSMKLRERKFVINTSQSFFDSELDFKTKSDIANAHLFFGILTGSGNQKDRVMKEWHYAKQVNTPVLLIIEDTIRLNPDFKGEYVVFNRNDPHAAMKSINQRMNVSLGNVKNDIDSALPWILGGAAALALLAIFSSNKE